MHSLFLFHHLLSVHVEPCVLLLKEQEGDAAIKLMKYSMLSYEGFGTCMFFGGGGIS